MAWKHKALILACISFVVWCSLVGGAGYLLLTAAATASGLLQGTAITLFALLCLTVTRLLIVRLKTFMITSLVEFIFIEVAYRRSREPVGKHGYVPPRMTIGSIDVSRKQLDYLRAVWFWRVPDNFKFLGCQFAWSWNPKNMLDDLTAVTKTDKPDVCDLSYLEFELSPTAKPSDVQGLGWPTFRFLSERKLNFGEDYNSWLFTVDRVNGIGVHSRTK